MITIRVPTEKDLIKIKVMTEINELDLKGFQNSIDYSMVVEDGEEIIGYGNYIVRQTIGVIENIFIKESFGKQSIGDGLIRALLNQAEKKGIIKIYVFTSGELSNFFQSLGFTKVIVSEEILKDSFKKYINSNDVYKVDIQEFFNKPCK